MPTELRPALASLYCAEVSAWLLQRIGGASMADVIVEGPLADNPVFGLALAALLAPRRLCRSSDRVEGTARGAWLLARWQSAADWQVGIDVLAEPEPELARQIRGHASLALNDAGL